MGDTFRILKKKKKKTIYKMSDIQNMKPSCNRNTNVIVFVCLRPALSDAHVYLYLDHIIENCENRAFEMNNII